MIGNPSSKKKRRLGDICCVTRLADRVMPEADRFAGRV